MRGVWALLLGLAVSARGAAQQASGGAAETVRTVHGVVVNSVTGAPVGRALVTTADQRMAQFTDAEGRFAFEVKSLVDQAGHVSELRPNSGVFDGGSIFLMARKPGYRPSERPAIIPLTNAKVLDETVRVLLVPESVVAGRVSVNRAEPPVGVPVQLMQRRVEDGRGVWRPMNFQQTNARGEYRFADLAAGEYKVLTREWTERAVGARNDEEPKVGYPPVGYPNGTNLTTAALVPVAAGETVEADMTLRAVPYFPVEIGVANAPGMGIGVQVEDGDGGSGFALGYDQRKQSVAGSLPAGSYKLLLTTYGERPMMAQANLTVAGPVKGGGLTLVPGASMRVEVREEFTSAPEKSEDRRFIGGNVMGTVGGGIGTPGEEPIPRDVDVNLQPISGEQRPGASLRNSSKEKRALNQGLVVENIQPGTYTVRVSPRRGYVASATVNGLDVLHKPLVVAAGSGVPPLDVTLRDDFAKLSGTVAKAGSGDASANGGYTMVWCFPLGEGAAAEPVPIGVDPQTGQLQNSMMPPGRYLTVAFDVQGMQNLAWREDETMKRLMAKGTVVILAPGGTASVSLTVVKGELE